MTESDYLLQQIRLIQEAYQKQIQPYVERLARLKTGDNQMQQNDALQMANELEIKAKAFGFSLSPHAAELRRLDHNNEVLMNALWKACGDDGQVVKDTIESQGELK